MRSIRRIPGPSAGILLALTAVLLGPSRPVSAQVVDLPSASQSTSGAGVQATGPVPTNPVPTNPAGATGLPPASAVASPGAVLPTAEEKAPAVSSDKSAPAKAPDQTSGTTAEMGPDSASSVGASTPANTSASASAASAQSKDGDAKAPSSATAPKTVKTEIDEMDADRSKLWSLFAQGMELAVPLPQLQQNVVAVEKIVGRTNPNVVVLYNIITTFHYRRAFANGQYLEASKMCRWMLDTETAAKSNIDEFFAAHTQIQLADLDRQLGNYKESLALLNASIPMLKRGNKAATKLVKDFHTMEGDHEYNARMAASRAKGKEIIASKKKYYDVLDKQLAETRYECTELGDLYFLIASDYMKLDNEAKAAEYLALAKANGVSMKGKNRSFEGKDKGTTKPATASGAKRKATTGAAKPALKSNR